MIYEILDLIYRLKSADGKYLDVSCCESYSLLELKQHIIKHAFAWNLAQKYMGLFGLNQIPNVLMELSILLIIDVRNYKKT